MFFKVSWLALISSNRASGPRMASAAASVSAFAVSASALPMAIARERNFTLLIPMTSYFLAAFVVSVLAFLILSWSI
jgi:hypothetical protein